MGDGKSIDERLYGIEKSIAFILQAMGYNPYTHEPSGNGILGRLDRLEKRVENLSPAAILSKAAAFVGAGAVLGGSIIWLMEHIKP